MINSVNSNPNSLNLSRSDAEMPVAPLPPAGLQNISTINESISEVSCLQQTAGYLLQALYFPIYLLAKLIQILTIDTTSQIEDSKQQLAIMAKGGSATLTAILEGLPIQSRNVFDLFLQFDQINHQELLKGATFEIAGDQGRYFHEWSDREDSHFRVSSHSFTNYAIRDPIFGELLFWVGENGSTLFQLENTSLFGGISNTLLHFQDYLSHLTTGRNIGPYGTSSFTPDNPIELTTSTDE